MTDNYNEFIENYDGIENALDQRNIRRWNGRDFRRPENLSEHTHLVVACAIELYDKLCVYAPKVARNTSFEKVVRMAMVHDSMEVLRGDILSITKDSVKGLREKIDEEEHSFMCEVLGQNNCDELTSEIVKLADLMACYKYVERELSWPTNKYVRDVYLVTKNKFDDAEDAFYKRCGVGKIRFDGNLETMTKGYDADAGIDIILKDDVVILPLSTMKIDLGVKITPDEGTMSYLCARTSAANRGLIVAMCPIDPNYVGDVSAMVHNVSNDVLVFRKGESFCQVVTVPILKTKTPHTVTVKKSGKRTDGKLGSTGL